MQIVYAARADVFDPVARDQNDYEFDAFFHPIEKINTLNLQPRHLIYLNAACTALR